MAKRGVDKTPKMIYPPGCKELSEELSNDELVRRLKVVFVYSGYVGLVTVLSRLAMSGIKLVQLVHFTLLLFERQTIIVIIGGRDKTIA